MLALRHARVFTGDDFVDDATVFIDRGVILKIALGHEPVHCPEESLEDLLLVPGFVDLQVNGGGDVLFNDDPSILAVRHIAEAHRAFGTTCVMPTFTTGSLSKQREALEAVRQALDMNVPGILGIHFEGPHINSAQKGIHDAALMSPVTEEYAALLEAFPEFTLTTVAPEIVGIEAIQRLARKGVRVCLGHSDADYATCIQAIDAGATGFTHLYNTMSPLHHRQPGMVGAALDRTDAWCGIIADGFHVHESALRLAWRVKGPERLFLVSDAAPPAGGKAKNFTMYGQNITVKEGRCVNQEGRLAGSAATLLDCVRHCVNHVGIPLRDALYMASLGPATFMGWQDRCGRIAPGYKADLVALNDGLDAVKVWANGQAVDFAS